MADSTRPHPLTPHPPVPPERVLPTLNADGSRRNVRPKFASGRYLRPRQLLGWGLMALFFVLPFVHIGGKPAILLDVVRREFTFFGKTFLATDGVLLMLLMLAIFVGVFFLSATLGRAWCGWACPQTVYMELLFRPLEYLLEGGRSATVRADKSGGGVRRWLKYAVFAALSWVLANQFLAYFVGVEQLWSWVFTSPTAHFGAFLVVVVTAALVFVDFTYFREQMCTVACPYARLQSVLLDDRSLIVGYDADRGEPRRKGKSRDGAGDCVDCGACVTACPTGIDIRDGLQLECIACTQCIDACDTVMDRLKLPRGLVRYTTKAEQAGKKSSWLRPRVLVYPAVLAALLTVLVVVGSSKGGADVTVLRGIGQPYVMLGDQVQNRIRIKVVNRTDGPRSYRIELLDAPGAELVAPENPLEIESGEMRTTMVYVLAPQSLLPGGRRQIRFRVSDGEGLEKVTEYRLLGPGVKAGVKE